MKGEAQRGSGFLLAHSCSIVFVLAAVLQPMHAATSAKDLLAAGHADEAIQTLEQQIQSAPDAESYNLLCRAYFMIADWDRGIPFCERATKLDPGKSLYHLWQGRVYGEKADRAGFLSAAGLAKKVRNAFERAVELDPRSSEARTDLAEFYIEAPSMVGGGEDKARAQGDALLRINPAMAHWVFARIAAKNKDRTEAEREYRAAIEVSHGTAQHWLHLAQFLAHANRAHEAEEALRNLESAQIDRADALMDGASLLLHLGADNSLAVRLLRRYLTSPSEEGPAFKAHDFLGQLLEKQGDRRAAAEEYRAALALSHTYTRAREGLKRVEP